MSENIRENTNMLEIFKQILSFQSLDSIQLLNEVLCFTDEETAPAVLGFVNCLLNDEIYVKEEHQARFAELVSEIIDVLREKLSKCLQTHLPDGSVVFSNRSSSVDTRPVEIIEEFKSMVVETLIRKSKYEIWNNINLFLNKKNQNLPMSGDTYVQSLLKYTNLVSQQHILCVLKEVAYLLTENDIRSAITHFEERPKDFSTLLLILKFTNKDILDKISAIIYSEKKYFKEPLVSALPEIDVNRILPNIKDYNWEIVASLVEKRPEIIPSVIQAFKDGVLGMQKKFFMEKILEKDRLFSAYFGELELTSEESIDLCSKSKCFTTAYYTVITTEEQVLDFCKVLVKKDEEFIIEFIKQNEDHYLFDLFLRVLTRTMRFTGKLKDFVVNRFSRQERFFHCLISYLDMREIEELLAKHYVKDLSVDSLLRKMHPQELLIEIHKFKSVSLGIKLITDCFDSNKFDDKDWVLAMKSLETIDSPVKIKTCYLILRKRPSLRHQAILFLKRSINDSIWDNQVSSIGIIKCMEILQNDCLQIFDAMNQEEIVFVLKKSPEIQKTVRQFFDEFRGTMTPKLRFLNRCLHRL